MEFPPFPDGALYLKTTSIFVVVPFLGHLQLLCYTPSGSSGLTTYL